MEIPALPENIYQRAVETYAKVLENFGSTLNEFVVVRKDFLRLSERIGDKKITMVELEHANQIFLKKSSPRKLLLDIQPAFLNGDFLTVVINELLILYIELPLVEENLPEWLLPGIKRSLIQTSTEASTYELMPGPNSIDACLGNSNARIKFYPKLDGNSWDFHSVEITTVPYLTKDNAGRTFRPSSV